MQIDRPEREREGSEKQTGTELIFLIFLEEHQFAKTDR